MFKKLLLTTVIAVGGYYLFGQNSSPINISGFIEYDHISYLNSIKEPLISGRDQGILQFDFEKKISENSMVFSSIELREDFMDKSKNRICPKEYYFNVEAKKFEFQLGKQIYSWGRSDGINVTDNLNPVDFSDLLDTDQEKIGVLSLSAKYYIKNWTFHGIYIPSFTKSIQPNQHSVWFPSFPEKVLVEGHPNTYLPVNYHFYPDLEPKNGFNNSQFAFKSDGKLRGIDFSFSYYNGYTHLPEVITFPISNPLDTLNMAVQNIYYQQEIIGFDFATSISSFGLRGEAGYFITNGNEAIKALSADNYLQYSVGIDYNGFIGQSNSSFLILAEWVHEVVPSGFEYSTLSFNHLFQEAIITRVEFMYRNILTISAQSLIDIKTSGYLLQPKIEYSITDNLKTSVQADIIEGEEDGIFGAYKNNDRIQIKIKYSF